MSEGPIPEANALARSSPAAMQAWVASAARLEAALGAGDDPSAPRVVRHEVHLPSPEAADLFIEVAAMRGFQCTAVARGAIERAVVAVREDSIALPHIHNVVMELHELAAPYDGDHVGWD